TALCHSLGEVREHHREPQPCRYRKVESGRAVRLQVSDEKEQGYERPNFTDEHYRVAVLPTWIELAERVDDGTAEDITIEERSRFGSAIQTSSHGQKVFPCSMRR